MLSFGRKLRRAVLSVSSLEENESSSFSPAASGGQFIIIEAHGNLPSSAGRVSQEERYLCESSPFLTS